jgi:hypothetical protein
MATAGTASNEARPIATYAAITHVVDEKRSAKKLASGEIMPNTHDS